LIRVSNDVDFISRRRKPQLRPRPGEDGRASGHPTQGQAFLHWSRHKTAFVVWHEIDVERGQCTPLQVSAFFYYAPEPTNIYR
jgi:hypothetical protein